MNKKIFVSVLIAILMLAFGCTTTGTRSGDSDVTRRSLDANADAALSRLNAQVAGSEQMVRQARGVLVFPSVLEAGFVVGASRGQGVLRVGGRR